MSTHPPHPPWIHGFFVSNSLQTLTKQDSNYSNPPPMENYSYSSYPDSGDSSPRSREIDDTQSWDEPLSSNYKVKFMCSYGGKIQPRPHDNQLAYIGGDTKILSLDRNVKFSAVVTKLSSLSAVGSDSSDLCVKYQLPGEDLDTPSKAFIPNSQELPDSCFLLRRDSPNPQEIMLTVSVKWQKEMFQKVEIDTTQPPYVFKCQLFDLTGVPPERQKIMVKGALLQDDGDWATIGVKQGQRLMMMGTADEIVNAPEKGPVFVEDLPEEEQVAAVGHTAGLLNLGNTCYMNSTVQCLHSVPELKSALLKYPSERKNEVDQTSHMLTAATRELFNELDKSVKAVAPMQFWMVLRKKYPQFGQMHNGYYMQQDAEECWTQLLYTLSQSIRGPSSSSENVDALKEIFGVELVSRVHCQESGEESSETESVYSLKCHISQEVNHMHEGLKHGLKSELEKASPALGRSAIFLKESRINALPRYLTVQFVRFFWKRESNQKAKILRKVDYPLVLDIFDLCSDDLRKQLEAPRKLLREEEGKKAGLKGKEKTDSKDTDVKMNDAEGSSGGESSKAPSDKTEQLTGIYDLVAVLTHKGRSADSGHYVAWVKQENGNWIEFDDDSPIPQREEDIVKLSGGGDWHMAYICMYKARTIPM